MIYVKNMSKRTHIKPYGNLELHIEWGINPGEPRTHDHPGEPRHAEINRMVLIQKATGNYHTALGNGDPELDITDFIYASPYMTEFEQHIREEIQEIYEI
jgi:hypothetical protein